MKYHFRAYGSLELIVSSMQNQTRVIYEFCHGCDVKASPTPKKQIQTVISAQFFHRREEEPNNFLHVAIRLLYFIP